MHWLLPSQGAGRRETQCKDALGSCLYLIPSVTHALSHLLLLGKVWAVEEEEEEEVVPQPLTSIGPVAAQGTGTTRLQGWDSGPSMTGTEPELWPSQAVQSSW